MYKSCVQIHDDIVEQLRGLSRGYVTKFRRYVLYRTGPIPCYWCGKPTKAGKRHTDHVVPISLGGDRGIGNMVCTCPACNTSKGKRPAPTPTLSRKMVNPPYSVLRYNSAMRRLEAPHAYRRHKISCPHRDRGPDYTLCECPVWVYATAQGSPIRRSLGTADWQRASERITALLEGADYRDVRPTGKSVKAAVAAYLADCRTRNLRDGTITSYKTTLECLVEWLNAPQGDALNVHGALRQVSLNRLDAAALDGFRQQRQIAPSTSRKELECLRAFLSWCQGRGWIGDNPARALKPPREQRKPTLPFSQEETAKLLLACDRIASDDPRENPFIRERTRALVLLLLYSGLRISDTAALRRNALQASGHLVLRTVKTGETVKVLLPAEVVDELRRLPARNPDYFFWSGRGKIATLIGNLRRTIFRLGKLAGIHGYPHRFRNTFACRLLETGADLFTVQRLLGHSSIKTTERHYAPFVASHQVLLDTATARLDFAKSARPLLLHTGKGARRDS